MIPEAAKLVSIVEVLPIEMKTEIVERILDSMDKTDPRLEATWIAEIERRIENLRTGKSKMIPGEEVFAKIEERLGK
jgi:putative addiction module component (TIGR02574 family)